MDLFSLHIFISTLDYKALISSLQSCGRSQLLFTGWRTRSSTYCSLGPCLTYYGSLFFFPPPLCIRSPLFLIVSSSQAPHDVKADLHRYTLGLSPSGCTFTYLGLFPYAGLSIYALTRYVPHSDFETLTFLLVIRMDLGHC